MPILNRAKLSPDQLTVMEQEIGLHRSLDEVLKWGLAQPAGEVTAKVVAEVITQDEYTHDVIVPWKDGLVIVYGIT